MSVVAAAGAEDLKTVDSALVLYVGSAIPPDGGDVIDTLDEVLSREVIGQETVRHSVSGEQSLVKFHEAYSEFSCLASWQANLESEDYFLLEWIKRLLPAPSFFHHLGGYGSEGEELSACPVDPATDPFLRADAQTAHLSFVIPDTRAPDWKNVELALHDALGRIVPRSGDPYAINALICPRILQFRTPVRAAVRMRPHTTEITRLLKEVVAGKTALREGLRLHLESVVPGLPTVSFPNGTRDFDTEEQPRINMFDVYFDRVSDFEGRVHGSGRPAREAAECVDLGNGDWPASGNVALRLDASLRFVWTQVAASTIPSAVDGTQVRRTLDALAGRKIRTEPARPPGPHAEVIDRGTQPMPDAHVAPLILAVIDAAARETGHASTPDGEAVAPALPTIGAGAPPADTEPAPDPDATPPHVPIPDPVVPEIATEPIPDTEVTATEVTAMGTAAPESETEPALDRGGIRPTPPAPGDLATDTGAVPFESWFVIEAYEDLNGLWQRQTVTIDSTPVAVSRAEAVRGVLGEDVRALETGFGRVEDFAAFVDTPTIVVDDDDVFFADQAQLERKRKEDNRTAFLTILQVPTVPPPTVAPRPSPKHRIEPSSVYTLASLRARRRGDPCVSAARMNAMKEQLETYRVYFTGVDYEPFSDLAEHKQSVLLLCRGHGPSEALTSARLGPVLLRALHKQDSTLFRRNDPSIRATLLHQIGEGSARRYYLFGHSLLTHFQRKTKARTLQSGTGDGVTPLCSAVPGLRIVEHDGGRDVCQLDSQGRFVVGPDESVADKLYHLVLPTTLAEHWDCRPRTVAAEPGGQATDPVPSSVTEKPLELAPLPHGCGDADVLPDPYALLEDLRDRTYVFRAAIDVAYTFTPRQ